MANETEPAFAYGLGSLKSTFKMALVDRARHVIREYAVYERHGPEFTFHVTLPSGKKRPSWLRVHKEYEVVELKVFADDPFNSLQRRRVIEIAHQLSARLVFGAFVYDPRDAIYYRHAIRIDDSGNVPEQIERLLNSCVFAMQLWASAYERLHEVRFSATVVVELACIENEVAKPMGLSKAATKTLLKLV